MRLPVRRRLSGNFAMRKHIAIGLFLRGGCGGDGYSLRNAMQLAAFKECRGAAEDVVHLTGDITIFKILPAMICIKRILKAGKTALSKYLTISGDTYRDS